MNILIVRTFGETMDATSYNVQEIGLAKAWVRAGHQADVVIYGGFKDDRTVLMPVDDSGVVRYDERLLGEDTYVREGNVDGDDPDRFISVYYLSGVSILKNGFFFSLKGIAKNYDIIQVHEYDQITSWLYYTNRRFRDRVVIYHGPYFHDFNNGYNLKCRVFDNLFLRFKSAPNTLCYTKSNAAAEFLRQKGFKNVYPVGVGLDTDAWEDILEQENAGAGAGIAGTEFAKALVKAEQSLGTLDAQGRRQNKEASYFTYIYVGKLEPRRNTIFLMDVVDRLLTEHEDTRMILIGTGDPEYKSRCLAKVQKWIDAGRIIYTPRVTQAELPAIYRMADCMLFPTIYDIFGMVLLEAIYFDLPVVTSNNGGADMLFENEKNAVVVDSLDMEAWVEAAARMHDDVDLYNRIKVALLDDRDNISWDAVVKRMLATWPRKQ